MYYILFIYDGKGHIINKFKFITQCIKSYECDFNFNFKYII